MCERASKIGVQPATARPIWRRMSLTRQTEREGATSARHVETPISGGAAEAS
jgi:hypothetical protein